METYLIVTDITGRQYPMLIPNAGIRIEDFTVTTENPCLDQIQEILEKRETIRINNQIFRTKKIIEIHITYTN